MDNTNRLASGLSAHPIQEVTQVNETGHDIVVIGASPGVEALMELVSGLLPRFWPLFPRLRRAS